ncbi:hypothetical protein NQZ68_029362 [Dissostichus eleginoides]|nr:hypothetical protein NQZ68_029362 [Dissostichus eleginoides]
MNLISSRSSRANRFASLAVPVEFSNDSPNVELIFSAEQKELLFTDGWYEYPKLAKAIVLQVETPTTIMPFWLRFGRGFGRQRAWCKLRLRLDGPYGLSESVRKGTCQGAKNNPKKS